MAEAWGCEGRGVDVEGVIHEGVGDWRWVVVVVVLVVVQGVGLLPWGEVVAGQEDLCRGLV